MDKKGKIKLGILLIFLIGIFSVNLVSAALTDGLVAYYSFDVGMNTTDSLYSKNLTNYGVTWNAAGKIGEAGDYEKDNAEYALTPNMGDLSAMTLCLWLKQETTSGSRRAFFGRLAPDPHLYGDLFENNHDISLNDSDKLYFGNSKDISANFDGTDFIWIQEVGSPQFKFGGNLNMSVNNVTNTDCIIFDSGGKICSS